MYIPKNWHWIGPTAIAMIPFYLRQNFPTDWTVYVFVDTPLAIGSVALSYWLAKAGVMYQAYVTQLDIRYGNLEPKADEMPTQANNEVPPVRMNGYASFETIAKPPKLNKEQKVANILIHQRNHNFDVNLKEEYWIKGRRFDGSRVEFVAMIDKWVGWQAIERAAARKNSPYVVRDWRVIELIAAGEYLPPPPQPVSLMRASQSKASE